MFAGRLARFIYLMLILLRFVSLLPPLGMLIACSATAPRSGSLAPIDTYCDPPQIYAYDVSVRPIANLDSVLAASPALARQFSRHDLLMANAIAIIPLLQQLTSTDHLPDSTLVTLRERIQNHLLLGQTQIASLAAELDCEGERADQLATYLDQQDSRRVRRLTIGSVVLGAITTVATALISGDDVNKTVAISGGLVSAGLGGAAAFSSNRRLVFMHKRNLLTDIWQQPSTSTTYPPAVWYVLNNKTFSNSGEHPIAFNIRQRWLNYVLRNTSKNDQTLYFAEGGPYSADDLHTRANMLNQLQSSVRSIDQDLQSLVLILLKTR